MQIQDMLLALIRAQLSPSKLTEEEIDALRHASAEEWSELVRLTVMQNVASVAYETLKEHPEAEVPDEVMEPLRQRARSIPMQYYQKIAVLRQILRRMQQDGVACYVLKGVGLNTMYPREEMRSFGDIDLYIPRPDDLEKVKTFFEEKECEIVETYSDNHTAYVYRGGGVSCEVEVHWRMTAEFNNGDIDSQLEAIYRKLDGSQFMAVHPMRTEVHILPPTYNALHLLAHMLQHLMYTGFGLKLFCDWTVFWQKCGSMVDTETFLGWIRMLHMENFLGAVTSVCIRYLGLEEACCPWMAEWDRDPALEDALMRDVFEGGEHGKYDSARMIITTRKPGLRTYLLELHRQMKRRYRRLGDCVILWPVLWLLTGIIFLYNNRSLRKTTAKEILDSNRKRNKLVQKLDIFKDK